MKRRRASLSCGWMQTVTAGAHLDLVRPRQRQHRSHLKTAISATTAETAREADTVHTAAAAPTATLAATAFAAPVVLHAPAVLIAGTASIVVIAAAAIMLLPVWTALIVPTTVVGAKTATTVSDLWVPVTLLVCSLSLAYLCRLGVMESLTLYIWRCAMNKEQRTYLTKRVDQIAVSKKRTAKERMDKALNDLPNRATVLLRTAEKAPKVVAAQLLACYVDKLRSGDPGASLYPSTIREAVPKFSAAIAAWEAERKAIEQTYNDYCKLVNDIRDRIVDSIMLGGTESACIELLHKFADESITEDQILDAVRKITEAFDER